MAMKGESPLIAGVLYVAIITVALTIVLQTLSPTISSMKDSVAIEQANDMMAAINNAIDDVMSEGTGSTRIIPINMKRGTLTIDSSNDEILYELETSSDLISPRTSKNFGSIVISSSATVNASGGEEDMLFESDFEGASPEWQEASGTWTVSGGNYIQSGPSGLAASYAGDNWTDYVVECEVSISSGNRAGLIFYAYEDNLYAIRIEVDSGKISLLRATNPSYFYSSNAYVSATKTFSNGVDYDLKAVANKGRIMVYVDGELLIDAKEGAEDYVSTRGRIGLWTYGSTAAFDNIEVYPLNSLENEHMRVLFAPFADDSDEQINVSKAIHSIYFKDRNELLDGEVRILVDDNETLENGTGRLYLKECGENLGKGVAIAHIDTIGASYDTYFTLESGEDFLQMQVRNFEET